MLGVPSKAHHHELKMINKTSFPWKMLASVLEPMQEQIFSHGERYFHQVMSTSFEVCYQSLQEKQAP